MTITPFRGSSVPGSALQPPPQCRRASVGAILIIDAVARQNLGEGTRVRVLLHLEGIEAGAYQEMKLVAQHVAGRAQHAAKTVGLAQQARLAVGAAVLEFRKYQHDEREVAEPRLKLRHAFVIGPGNAKRAIAANKGGGIRQKPLGRHDNRDAIRDRRLVIDADVTVFDDAAVFNELHRHAP